MKQIQFPTTGLVKISKHDFDWQTAAMVDIVKAFGRVITNGNTAPVILNGMAITISGGSISLASGYLYWNDEIFYCAGISGVTGTNPVWLTVSTNFASFDAVGGVNIHAVRDANLYQAASAANTGDANMATLVNVADQIKALIGFNPSVLANNTAPSWTYIGTTGAPLFQAGWGIQSSVSVGYFKYQFGKISCRGWLKMTSSSAGTNAFYLSGIGIVNGDKKFNLVSYGGIAVIVSIKANSGNPYLDVYGLSAGDYIDLTPVAFYL